MSKKIRLTMFIFYFVPTLLSAQFDWVPYANNPVINENFDPGALEISRPSVVFDGSTYHLWYSNTRSIKIGIVEAPLNCIGYATSPDGINWTLVDTTVFAPTLDNTQFDQIHASQGWVMADNDTFKIWYWGYNPNYGELGMNSFGYAWSTDGRSWTKVPGPGMFGSVYDQVMDGNLEGIGLATPCVVKDGNMYHLWYSRVEVIPFLFRIAYATSPDGINWTNVPGTGTQGAVLDWGAAGSFDDITVAWPAVVKTEQGFIMWYFGVAQNGGGGLGCATSMDGVNWTRVRGNGTNGACFDEAQAVSVSQSTIVVEKSGKRILPNNFVLEQNYPNPFNPETVIEYQLPHAAEVEISIFNLQGQKMITLIRGHRDAGFHKIIWNGTDEFGRTVASGVYLYQLKIGKFTQVKKMMLLR